MEWNIYIHKKVSINGQKREMGVEGASRDRGMGWVRHGWGDLEK
jgi:hypothetical protein